MINGATLVELPLGPDPKDDENRPFADRMRPTSFEEVVGQEHLLEADSLFAEAVKTGKFPSIIFWGPPGCGKTTLARLISDHTEAIFVEVSAISSGTADLREIFKRAGADKGAGKRTLLFVDEIHRFNRAQQDLFLPYIENGTILLVGATTENPSFELNGALLSRCQVLTLKVLDENAAKTLLKNAEAFAGKKLALTDDARDTLLSLPQGDGRYLLNCVEEILKVDADDPLDSERLLKRLQRRMPLYDKGQDGHYNALSAFHKSMRASDVNGALYWAARMLDAGEDPASVIRRMVACSSEDVGMADPQALVQALAAKDAYEFLGMPEALQCISQAICYICTAPKSNKSYLAMHAAMRDAKQTGNLMPPKHAMNAPTQVMKDEGYKQGYIYDHDTPQGYSGLSYFPDELGAKTYYEPVDRGFERDIKKRLEYFAKLRG